MQPWKQSLWAQVRRIDPIETAERAGVLFRPLDRALGIDFLSEKLWLSLAEERIEDSHGNFPQDSETEFLVLSYLCNVKNEPQTGVWITERQLPGGNLFFQGPHRLPYLRIIERFGRDADGFLKAGQAVGAEPLEFGDASLAFQVFPRIRFGCVLWIEDDEFPARVTFLFDESLKRQLPLDVVLGLVNVVVRAIGC